jgi:hypothetical protein
MIGMRRSENAREGCDEVRTPFSDGSASFNVVSRDFIY